MSSRTPTRPGIGRRTVAGLVALVLVIALWAAAALMPLPYVTYSPGLTINVLGETGSGKDAEIVQVSGHEAYRTGGELRLTTVYVTRPSGHVDLFEALTAWWDPERAIYPREAVYGGESPEEAQRHSAVAMASSQETAVAAALRALGRNPRRVVEVLNVADGMPADGKLQVGDVVLRAGGKPVDSPEDIVRAVESAGAGEPVTFVVLRDGERRTVTVTPRRTEGEPRIGIVIGPGFDFSFDVDIRIPQNIGGPSAGLIFALAIYDTLTPGSLTGGKPVAGTGTIDARGNVGPIGGIQQKIVAARRDGAQLFLVPPKNCEEALEAPHEGIRLVKAKTLESAIDILKTWSENPDAELPSCRQSTGSDG